LALPQCADIAKFSDTDSKYISDTISEYETNNSVKLNVIDLSAKEFREYEIFGTFIRLVGKDIYFHSESASSKGYTGFDPVCSDLNKNIQLPLLGWKSSEDQPENYIYTLNNNLSDNDLNGIDLVLSTLKLK